MIRSLLVPLDGSAFGEHALPMAASLARRAGATVDEQPATAVMHEARLRHAGLIAMETHGRRGLSRLLLGSVADKIVRGGATPVLLHRPRS